MLSRLRPLRPLLAITALLSLVLAGQAATGRSTGTARFHQVRRGETLSHIARATGVSIAELASANGIANVHRVRAGTRLTIPTPGAAAPAGAAAAPASGRRVQVSAKLPPRLRAQPDRLALIPTFDAAAQKHGVPADLLKAMTWMESGWQNGKVSRTKAVGIGQLMPATVDFVNRYLLRASLDPGRADHNIHMSARYLRFLLDRSKGDVRTALASYYQGPASVARIGWYDDTKAYVAAVEALRPRFA